MRPELRKWTHYFDASGPLDPENFETLALTGIGPAGEEGLEWFDFVVCTPAWLAANVPPSGYYWGRFMLIVPRWDETLIEQAIHTLIAGVVDACEKVEQKGAVVDWALIAERLASYGAWEFGGWALPSEG